MARGWGGKLSAHTFVLLKYDEEREIAGRTGFFLRVEKAEIPFLDLRSPNDVSSKIRTPLHAVSVATFSDPPGTC